MEMKQNTRRNFLKKAAYATPGIIALGALAPTAVNAKANSAILGLRSKIQTNKTDITGYKSEIKALQDQKALLTGPSNRDARAQINAQIDALQAKIAGERAENKGYRSQIKILRG